MSGYLKRVLDAIRNVKDEDPKPVMVVVGNGNRVAGPGAHHNVFEDEEKD